MESSDFHFSSVQVLLFFSHVTLEFPCLEEVFHQVPFPRILQNNLDSSIFTLLEETSPIRFCFLLSTEILPFLNV